jgi:hypothetical protein
MSAMPPGKPPFPARLFIAAALVAAILGGAAFWIVHYRLAAPSEPPIVLKDVNVHPKPPAPSSGPLIGGIAVNEQGTPLADVLVSFSWYTNDKIRTDGNGLWTYSGIPRDQLGRLRIDLVHDQYAAYSYEHPPMDQLLARSLVLVMRRSVDVRGVVVDASGNPLPGAYVTTRQDQEHAYAPDTDPHDTTDASGHFTIRNMNPGRLISLAASRQDLAPTIIWLRLAAHPPPVRLVLNAGYVLRGRVTDIRGRPIEGAEVQLFQCQGIGIHRRVSTDHQGEYELDNAPAGWLEVTCGKAGVGGTYLDHLGESPAPLDFTLLRGFHVHGKVTDAVTHQPVPQFNVLAEDANQPLNFHPGTSREFWSGRYQYPPSGYNMGAFRHIRIEANGYQPAISPLLKESGEQDFAMTPGRDLTGRVVDTGGKPVAHLTVGVGRPGELLRVWSNELIDLVNNSFWQGTNAAGKFDLPPQSGKFTVVAVGSEGYAVADQDQMAKAATLQLVPWGRIEGRILIDGLPAPGEELDIRPSGPPPDGQNRASVEFRTTYTTDSQGRFFADCVPCGWVDIGCDIHMPGGTLGFALFGAPARRVLVTPGKTLSVILGGTGRPVVGRVQLPAGSAAGDEHFFIATLQRQPAAPDSIIVQAPVEIDGTFRFESVEPGTYGLQIRDELQHDREAPPTGAAEFTVPDLPGGAGDVPLEIPTVTLKRAAPL